MKKALKWGLGILVALIVLVAAVGGNENKTAEHATSSASEPVKGEAQKTALITVSSVELGKAYEENEASADSQYKDKALAVSGKVTAITKDITDNTVVALQGSNSLVAVQGTLTSEEAPKALKLKKGNKVTLLCTGGGEVASFPMLSDCALK